MIDWVKISVENITCKFITSWGNFIGLRYVERNGEPISNTNLTLEECRLLAQKIKPKVNNPEALDKFIKYVEDWQAEQNGRIVFKENKYQFYSHGKLVLEFDENNLDSNSLQTLKYIYKTLEQH